MSIEIAPLEVVDEDAAAVPAVEGCARAVGAVVAAAQVRVEGVEVRQAGLVAERAEVLREEALLKVRTEMVYWINVPLPLGDYVVVYVCKAQIQYSLRDGRRSFTYRQGSYLRWGCKMQTRGM